MDQDSEWMENGESMENVMKGKNNGGTWTVSISSETLNIEHRTMNFLTLTCTAGVKSISWTDNGCLIQRSHQTHTRILEYH